MKALFLYREGIPEITFICSLDSAESNIHLHLNRVGFEILECSDEDSNKQLDDRIYKDKYGNSWKYDKNWNFVQI